MSFDLQANTPPGERLVALAEELADELAAVRGRVRPARQLPLQELRRAEAERILHRSDPRAAGRPGRHVRARRDRRLEPARARRRVADARREHALRLRVERRAALADGRRRRQRAARRCVRRDARADRSRRRRLRGRGERAGAGPDPPRDDGDANGRRLDRVGPQGLLHDVARGGRPLHGGHVRRRATAASATATRWCRARRPAWSSTTTGTRSACAPRAATPSPSTTSSCRPPPSAAASRRASLSRTWSAT